MFLRTTALFLAASLFAAAGFAPKAPGTDAPAPSLIVNDSSRTFRVRLSSSFSKGEYSFGAMRIYPATDTELKTRPEEYADRGRFVLLKPKSSLQMVLAPTKYTGCLMVYLNISLDLAEHGAPVKEDVVKLQFAHFQYNRSLIKAGEFLARMKELGLAVPSMVQGYVEKMPKDIVTVKASSPQVTTTAENYQKGDEGPLCAIKD